MLLECLVHYLKICLNTGEEPAQCGRVAHAASRRDGDWAVALFHKPSRTPFLIITAAAKKSDGSPRATRCAVHPEIHAPFPLRWMTARPTHQIITTEISLSVLFISRPRYLTS